MNYRVAEILASKTLDPSGTEVIPIRIQDPISAMLFEYKNVRGSSTSIDHVAGCLSKIELIDGSDVLFSLSGKQLHALDFYDKGKTPYTFIMNYPGGQQILGMSYNFGRKLWDDQLAFEPKKFDNPQLKITHNRATCDADSSNHYLRILGFLFDEKIPSPIGFLSSREIVAYTPGDNLTYKYIDMPTDRVIRKMLIEAYDDAYSPYQVVRNIKLSEDNDKRVVMDESFSLWMKYINSIYPQWEETLLLSLITTAMDQHITPSFALTIAGKADVQAAVVDVEAGVHHSPVLIGSDAAAGCHLLAKGYNPHSIMPIPFGDQMDIDDWYDATKVGNLQAILQTGAAAENGAVKVFLQQLRRG